MEFGWPEDLLTLREEVTAFLRRELPEWWGIGSNTLTAGTSVHEFCDEFAARLARHGI